MMQNLLKLKLRYMTTRVLVIGAKGQLGQSFKYCSKNFSSFNFSFEDLPNFDLLDHEQLVEYFKSKPINVVINCAAYTEVDKAEKELDKAIKLNLDAVQSLCKLSKKYKFKLIHYSTDYVFDGTENNPYNENHPINPIGVYGKTKAAGEKIIMQERIDSWIIRTSWLFSPFGKNFVKSIYNFMKYKDKINVVADQKGSPTYAIDLAKFTMKALEEKGNSKGPKIYHFTNNGVTSWFELSNKIKNIINSPCRINPITTEAYESIARRPKYSVLSCEKIKREFKMKPQSWEFALEDCLKKMK